MNENQSAFLNLPEDVHHHIFKYIDYASNTPSVSKYFYSLFNKRNIINLLQIMKNKIDYFCITERTIEKDYVVYFQYSTKDHKDSNNFFKKFYENIQKQGFLSEHILYKDINDNDRYYAQHNLENAGLRKPSIDLYIDEDNQRILHRSILKLPILHDEYEGTYMLPIKKSQFNNFLNYIKSLDILTASTQKSLDLQRSWSNSIESIKNTFS